jgi:hypothetical protein
MTEQEWLAATDPTPMLRLLEGKVSDRKLRLFACACARDVEDCTRRWGNVSVTELVERYADGQAAPNEVETASADVKYAAYGQVYQIGDAFGVIEAAIHRNSYESATQAAMWLKGFYHYEAPEYPGLRPVAFCRDLFGNPFRPILLEPACRTSTVLSLAQGIYADRAFDRLPILADALQDAGCDNDDILTHCLGLGPHVRGCWVIDLLLGKE